MARPVAKQPAAKKPLRNKFVDAEATQSKVVESEVDESEEEATEPEVEDELDESEAKHNTQSETEEVETGDQDNESPLQDDEGHVKVATADGLYKQLKPMIDIDLDIRDKKIMEAYDTKITDLENRIKNQAPVPVPVVPVPVVAQEKKKPEKRKVPAEPWEETKDPAVLQLQRHMADAQYELNVISNVALKVAKARDTRPVVPALQRVDGKCAIVGCKTPAKRSNCHYCADLKDFKRVTYYDHKVWRDGKKAEALARAAAV